MPKNYLNTREAPHMFFKCERIPNFPLVSIILFRISASCFWLLITFTKLSPSVMTYFHNPDNLLVQHPKASLIPTTRHSFFGSAAEWCLTFNGHRLVLAHCSSIVNHVLRKGSSRPILEPHSKQLGLFFRCLVSMCKPQNTR